MKKAMIMASIASLTFPISVLAQAPDAFKPRPTNGKSGSNNKSATEDTHTRDNNQRSESPYGKEIPMFDAENEKVVFLGSEFSLQDNRFADQFSGYLVQSQAKIEEAAKYRKILSQIRESLEHNKRGTRRSRLSTGYALLKKAAGYPADGKVCESLQNAIAMAEIALNNTRQSDADIRRMKEEHAKLVRKMEFIESRTKLDPAEKSSTPGAGKPKGTASAVGGVEGQENLRRRAELLLMMKKSEITGNIGGKFAKIQYQAVLMQLFMQRRFEHCVIGCRFYNLIFSDGENKLGIQKGSDMHKFFSDTLGVQPTVAGLDAACNDMIGKAKKSADSVRNHLARKQVHQATQRMVEAYAIGEHLTPIHTFDPDMRNRMHQYILDSKNLKDAAKVKNWQHAETYTKKLRDQAVDFRFIQAETAISAYKRASNLEITQFYAAKQQKNDAKAEGHIANAISFWPTNPHLETLEKRAFNEIEDGMDKLKIVENKATEFEGIKRNKNFDSLGMEDAGVFKQTFLMARNNNKLSEEQRDHYSKLYDEAANVFTKLTDVEKAIGKADGLAKEGQYEAAWEAIHLEYKKDHIAKRKIQDKENDLARKAARYRDLFDDAQKFIGTSDFGSALSCYLKARSLNPKSQMAKDGINEMIKIRQSEQAQ